ncbi:MAG TPA: hypothetical protein VMZ50_05855 [Phycisphaerae bacterium]|nr:hypothetical protein [Phycisphaerae bacterium]
MDAELPLPEWILVDAVRYAFCRRSYVVGDTTRLVRRVWPMLSPKAREVIVRDVENEVGLHDRMAKTGSPRWLGPESIVREWRSLISFLRNGAN